MSRKLDLIDEEKCDKVAPRSSHGMFLVDKTGDKIGNVRTKSHVTLNKMKIISRFLLKQSFLWNLLERERKRKKMEELEDCA